MKFLVLKKNMKNYLKPATERKDLSAKQVYNKAVKELETKRHKLRKLIQDTDTEKEKMIKEINDLEETVLYLKMSLTDYFKV